MSELDQFLAGERFYPRVTDIFRAFELTALANLKAVILGQDPYPRPGEAMGLCFSVRAGATVPRSLESIYQEVERGERAPAARCGDLTHWAKQGVLLLNATLTVRQGANQEGSHMGHGWECFTDEVVRLVSKHQQKAVFCLWGRPAHVKAGLLAHTSRDRILLASHPAPPAAYRDLPATGELPACHAFRGCGHFRMINRLLPNPIRW